MSFFKNSVKRIVKQRWAYFLLLPGYLFFLIFSFIPILRTMTLSLYKANIIRKSWVGIENYLKILHDETFKITIVNTVKYTVLIVPAVVTLSLIISAVIFPLSNKIKSIVRGALYLPNIVGGVIMSSIWLWMLNPNNGLINYLINVLGLSPVMWLGDPNTAIYALSFIVVTWAMGTPTILFLAAMGNVPVSLYESAKIDGSTAKQEFFYITLPMIRPVMSFIITTQLIGIFQLWEVVYMTTLGGPVNSTRSIVFHIYQTAFESSQYGMASAQGVILMILIAIITFISMKVNRITDI